jgi:hypothetical protein
MMSLPSPPSSVRAAEVKSLSWSLPPPPFSVAGSALSVASSVSEKTSAPPAPSNRKLPV